MYYFKSLERPISNSELSEIEKKINVILPEDYKEFLLEVNVGIPKEQYLSFFIDDLNEEVILGTMLGISENKNFSLTDWNSEYQIELPYDSFVFGTEYGGGLFVMIVSGEDRGIYFWDHTFIFDQSSVDSNVYFLADDFTNFIEKLYISEP